MFQEQLKEIRRKSKLELNRQIAECYLNDYDLNGSNSSIKEVNPLRSETTTKHDKESFLMRHHKRLKDAKKKQKVGTRKTYSDLTILVPFKLMNSMPVSVRKYVDWTDLR